MNQRTKGTLQVALAAVFWSFAGVLCKWLPWNSITTNGVRSLFATLLFIMVRGTWRVKLTRGTLLGALGAAATSVLYMAAAKLTSAANAIVLQYAMPVFVIVFCWIFYHQRPPRHQLVTAGCVLAGVILCSWDGLAGGGNWLGDLLALLAAVTFSLVFFCSRLPDANATDYSYLGCALGILFVPSAFFDPAVSLNVTHWLAAFGMGVALAGGYYFISKGMLNTSPVTAAILANLEPILNPIWVFLFLGEQPGALTLAGAAVVLVSATVYSVIGAKKI